MEWGIGDGGLGIGDWGLGPIPNPQSPIPNPQSPFLISIYKQFKWYLLIKFNFKNIIKLPIIKFNLVSYN